MLNQFYNIKNKIKKKIKIETLDDFSIDHGRQNVLKIDTQGYELEVLRGGGKTLKLFDIIIIECSFVNEYLNSKPTFVEVVQLLKKKILSNYISRLWKINLILCF